MGKENKDIQIAFLTALDLNEISSWSWGGVFHHMIQALQRNCGEVFYIGPIHCREQLIARAMHKGSRLLLKKNFTVHHNFLVAKQYAKVAAKRLAQRPYDVIIAPAGETEIAFLQTDIPIVLIEDATYGQLIDYYPAYSNLSRRCNYELQTIERLAIKKASMIASSSDWAAQSAIEDYHADKQHVHVVPFGANFTEAPPSEIIQQRKKSDHLRLLFMGVDWERKGGEIAFETLVKLNEAGIRTELIVCGCVPPPAFAHEQLRVIPFLDKRDKHQLDQLIQLYLTSDFLLLPTRGDCTPIVFSEANAYGLPVITTETGGVSGIITNGQNGFMLSYDARGDAYAEVIAATFQNDKLYDELVKSSRIAFETRLNWDAWGNSITNLLQKLLEQKNTLSVPV